MAKRKESGKQELKRALGLKEAAAIAMGTMVGAGIFVFPGMAAGRAGMAAALSFALGALISLPVALAASELATAMPRSGGGYFFVSRSMGGLLGAVVGISLWWGLVFASAFYLVGFGHYFSDLLHRIGVSADAAVVLSAVVAGIALTTVNVLGTKKAGQLQNVIVALLLVLLVSFLGYGLIDTLGIVDAARSESEFLPHGMLPVLTTTSLIYTSYLGFSQVAGVAGEVQDPEKTLPRSMIGSVIAIGLLYVAAVFVASSVFSSEQLAEFGETAMIEVAKELLGVPGALVILVAGLLATLSSANASLLSSSRTVYALARDRFLPRRASSVNERFGTPHFSIVGAGVPIVLLTLFGRIEVLAEVASFLHLLMYGLICAAVIKLRHDDPIWYRPTFRVPFSPWLPAFGGIASVAVIVFMQPLSIGLGLGIAALSAGWYYLYARDISKEDLLMADDTTSTEEATFLVSLKLPDPAPPDKRLLELLGNTRVHLLGSYIIAEQTTPEQARDEFGEEARKTLQEYEETFHETGKVVSTQLVFTSDIGETLDQVEEEIPYEAILIPGDAEALGRMLVVLSGEFDSDAVLRCVSLLLREDEELRVTLLNVTDEEAEVLPNEAQLEQFKAGLVDRGVDEQDVEVDSSYADDPVEATSDYAEDFDLVVVVETAPTVREKLFGGLWKNVADDFDGPVVIVSLPQADED